MTLARSLALKLGVLTGVLAFAGAAVGWGLHTLGDLTTRVRHEFEELRDVQQFTRHLDDARHALNRGEQQQVRAHLANAIAAVEQFYTQHATAPPYESAARAEDERHLTLVALAALQRLPSRVGAAIGEPAALGVILRDIDEAEARLRELADRLAAEHVDAHQNAARQFRMTFWGLGAMFVVLLVAAVFANLAHYRSVMGPLQQLQEGAARLAAGDLSARVKPQTDDEFGQVQRAFDRMADELETLYRDLERRVAQQSKQLATAERLSSVGYLAAGVAHEINNPLAIMTGYAESILRRLEEGASDLPPCQQLKRDLEIIRNEAFRCKRITHGLLDLARSSGDHRAHVSLRATIGAVVGVLRATPMGANRNVTFNGGSDDALSVIGSEPELRQVLLNLALNALQAVEPDTGRVELEATRRNGWIEVTVADNGCGMDPETLERLFEPFYTTKRESAGIGLGLTISHAIVLRHGGTLTAASRGPGCGSIFVMRLPACPEEDTSS